MKTLSRSVFLRVVFVVVVAVSALLATAPSIRAQDTTSAQAKGLHFAPDTDGSRAAVMAFLKNPPADVLAEFPTLKYFSTLQVKGPIHLYAVILDDLADGGLETAQNHGGIFHSRFGGAGSESGKATTFCLYEVFASGKLVVTCSFEKTTLKAAKPDKSHLIADTISIDTSGDKPAGTVVISSKGQAAIYVNKSGEATGYVSGIDVAMGAFNRGVGQSIITVGKSGASRTTVWVPRSIDAYRTSDHREVARAIEYLSTIPQVQRGSYEVRLFLAVGYKGIDAIWLKSDSAGTDMVYVYPTGSRVNSLGETGELIKVGLYTADEFLNFVRPWALKSQKLGSEEHHHVMP